MKGYRKRNEKRTPLYVGADMHKSSWHVTALAEGEEVFSGATPPKWHALRRLLDRYPDYTIHVVYEAGYFGFCLYDEVIAYGAQCTATPPSLIPMEYGNRVKTDRRADRLAACVGFPLPVISAPLVPSKFFGHTPAQRDHLKNIRTGQH